MWIANIPIILLKLLGKWVVLKFGQLQRF